MSYHAAHLTPDAARTVVWRVIAWHLARWMSPDAAVLELGAGYCDWINHVRAARRVATDVWPDFGQHAADGVETMVLDAGRDLSRLTSRDDASLPVTVSLLAQVPGALPLDQGLSDLLRLLVAPRRVTRAAR